MTKGSGAEQQQGLTDGRSEVVEEGGMARVRDRIEVGLNALYGKYRNPPGEELVAIIGFTMHVSMFHYDIAREVASLEGNKPTGFVLALALKGAIHRTVEFEKHLRNVLIPKMHEIAASFNADFPRQKTREVQRQFRPAVAQVLRWERIRNKATGHYDSDIDLVVNLLDGLSYEDVIETVLGFMHYSGSLLEAFRDALAAAPPR